MTMSNYGDLKESLFAAGAVFAVVISFVGVQVAVVVLKAGGQNARDVTCHVSH